jgi:hypothetical protein
VAVPQETHWRSLARITQLQVEQQLSLFITRIEVSQHTPMHPREFDWDFPSSPTDVLDNGRRA